MVSRSLLALFAVALIAASVSAAPAEVVDVNVDSDFDEEFERGLKDWIKEQAEEAAKKIIQEAVDFVKKEAKKVNLDCVKEVYNLCDINPVKHPRKYYKCAKNYFVENKEHCYHDEE